MTRFIEGLYRTQATLLPDCVDDYIGEDSPVPLLDFIACIERVLGKTAEKRLLPLQDGDVPATYANTDALNDWVGFVPATPIDEGIANFVAWYRDYYRAG